MKVESAIKSILKYKVIQMIDSKRMQFDDDDNSNESEEE